MNPKLTEKQEKEYQEILNMIGDDGLLQSLLYDLNLLPECVEKYTEDWNKMLNVCIHWGTLIKRETKE